MVWSAIIGGRVALIIIWRSSIALVVDVDGIVICITFRKSD